MNDPVEKSPDEGKPAHDVTGRDRMVSNVLFSWGAHLVFVVAGFIMPRMIDRRLGQDLLGVWDFAWSLVSYFTLVEGGVSSSVHRYVAKYRAADDRSSMNCIISSAGCVLGVAGLLVMGAAVAAALLLPRLFGTRLGENVREAQWVVFLLGTSLGVEIFFSVFTGILTGCHRWVLHNAAKSGWYAATVVGMIIALQMNAGLSALALITLAGTVLAEATRIVMAYRICEGLQLRLSLVRWQMVTKSFVFGGKTLVPSLSGLLLHQTTSVLIVAYLGPAALALYARPRSLVRHIHTLVNKMANTLTPTVSSLQSMQDSNAIRELLVKSVRYSLYMALPMVLVLAIFGGPILEVWMGPQYASGMLPAILAVGYLATMAQSSVYMVLVGLNAHGRAGMAEFIASLGSVTLTFITLRYLKLGLTGTAVAVILPLTVMSVGYLPLLVCRRVGLDLKRYILAVTLGPAVHVSPFVVCLLTARLVFDAEPLKGLTWGLTIGGLLLAFQYYRYVLPSKLKRQMCRLVGLKSSLA